MTSDSRTEVVLALRVVAAMAERLARELEAGRLWPGEASDAMKTIRANFEAAERSSPR